MRTSAVLDVKHLPPDALDARSPVWWGNTLLLLIETSSVALLLVSYFYLWRNYPHEQWPPPRVIHEPPLYDPVPDLWFATLNTLLLLSSSVVLIPVGRAARRHYLELERVGAGSVGVAPSGSGLSKRPAAICWGLLVLSLLGAAAFTVRLYEFPGLKVSWNDDAYAALVWSLIGLHLIYILVGTLELGVLAFWSAVYGVDQNRAIDVTLTGTYWHWTVGVWVVLYGVVYWFPRIA